MEDLAGNLAGNRRALAIAFVITGAFLVAEVAGGLLTGSLALLADAGHMASDIGALGLAWAAALVAARPPTPGKTFGFYRAEILAALINGVALLAVAGYILWEASQRLADPPQVKSGPMLAIASAGLVANLVAASVLSRQRQASLNVRAAFLHVLGDTAGSVGAILAGLIMLTSGQFLADPAISVVIAGLILIAGWRLLGESTNILLEGAPPGLEARRVQAALLGIRGVEGIHDLHLWTLTSGFISMSAHIETDENHHQHDILVEVRRLLVERFGIRHATIQLETKALHEELEACCGIDSEEGRRAHVSFHD